MSRILFIRGGAIGDFILTLPILEAIHNDDPKAEIDILGYPSIAELAVGRRLSVSSRDVGRAEWAPLFSEQSEFAPGEQAYLRAFDCIYCIWPDGDGVMVANLKRVGVRKVIHVNPMPPSDSRDHVIDFMVHQCRAVGLEIQHREPHLYPSSRDRWWAERYMRVTGAGNQPLLGLHAGSGSASKNWSPDRFAEVAEAWIERYRGHVLVLAGPADDEPLSALRSRLDEDKIFVFRNEPLPRVAAVLERCEAFVGNDSGISHMAAAVRTPSAVVFGPTDAKVWRPYAVRVAVLEASRGGAGINGLTAKAVMQGLDDMLHGAS